MRGSEGLIPHVNIMGLTAALAGFKDGQDWLDQCLSYLRSNRDFLVEYVRESFFHQHDAHGGNLPRLARLHEIRNTRESFLFLP